MQIRWLTGNLAGKIEELPQHYAEAMVDNGSAESLAAVAAPAAAPPPPPPPDAPTPELVPTKEETAPPAPDMSPPSAKA